MTDSVHHDDGMARRTRQDSIYKRIDNIIEEAQALRSEFSRYGVPSVRLMGVTEVASELGVTTSLVSTWLARGKMPEPIARLKATPVWTESQLGAMLHLRGAAEDE